MEPNPMISPNMKLWVKIGYVFPKDHRMLCSVVPELILCVLQFANLLFSADDLQTQTLNAYFAALALNCNFRILVTLKNRKKFEKFLTDMDTLYLNIMESGDDKIKELLTNMQFWANLFTKANWLLSSLAILLFVSYPIVLQTGRLPYALYIPGVDFYASPTYEVAYFLEVILTVGAVFQYIPFVNMFIAFICFGIVLIRILHLRFNTIAETEVDPIECAVEFNLNVERRFKRSILLHKRVIEYVDDLNMLMATILLVEIILFGTLLLALLFAVIMANSLSEQLWGCVYIYMIMFQLFAMYYLSNEIIEQSTNLGFALYDTPWFLFNTKNRRTLLLVLLRTQAPMQIMLGTVAPVTLQTFQSILNVSYSYFNILRGGLADNK